MILEQSREKKLSYTERRKRNMSEHERYEEAPETKRTRNDTVEDALRTFMETLSKKRSAPCEGGTKQQTIQRKIRTRKRRKTTLTNKQEKTRKKRKNYRRNRHNQNSNDNINNLCESFAESCTESNEFSVEPLSEPIECNEVVILTKETMLTTTQIQLLKKVYPSYQNQNNSISVNSTKISQNS